MVWDERMSEYVPWRVEAARILLSGEFPVFTDRVFGGMPLFATAYTGVLYPPNLLYLFAPATVANFLEALHTFLAATGMYTYLRARRISPWAAFIGGLLFSSSTFLMHHAGHLSMREAACLGPWVAWSGLRLLAAPGAGRLAAFSGLVALQISTGYPQLVLLTGLWLLLDWLSRFRLNLHSIWGTLALAAGLTVGAGLMTVQVYSSLAHVEETPRADLPPEARLAGSLPPHLTLQFAQPRLIEALDYEWAGERYGGEWGSAPLPLFWVLALTPLLCLAHRRFRRSYRLRWLLFLWGGIFFSLLLSFGKHFPPATIVLDTPPFDLFRIPSRWLFLTTVFAAVAAAIGLDWMSRLRVSTRMAYVLTAYLVLLLVTAAAWKFLPLPDDMSRGDLPSFTSVMTGTSPEPALPFGWWTDDEASPFLGTPLIRREWQILLPLLLAAILCAGWRCWTIAAPALLVLIVLKWHLLSMWYMLPPRDWSWLTDSSRHPLLGQVDRSEIARVYSPSPLSGDWGYHAPGYQVYPHNTHLFAGVRGLQGYTPLHNRRLLFSLNIGQTGSGWRDAEMYENPVPLQSLGVTHILVQEDMLGEPERTAWETGLAEHYDVIARHEGDVLARLRETAPRFQFARRWTPVEHTWEAEWALWHTAGHGIRDATVLVESPPWDMMPPPDVDMGDGTVHVLVDRPSYQRLHVQAPAEGGVLLVRDVHWRGWYYRIPGTELGERWHRMRPAQSLLRAAPVLPGEHMVELAYRQPKLRQGLTVSLVFLVAWLLMAGWAAFRSWHRRKTPQEG